MTKQEEFEKALAQFDIDADVQPLTQFENEVDLQNLPHKTMFTILGESQGRSWESSWLIPRDINETDWTEIQRMLKLAMTTLCRLPIDDAIGVLDPEGYKKVMANRRMLDAQAEKAASAVYGEEGYTPKYDDEPKPVEG